MRDPLIQSTSKDISSTMSSKRRNTDFERISLPIDDVKDHIVQVLIENPTSIIIGETGSGKSTQIPQICLDAGLGKRGKIACTQPRRVAAISLANRVSIEMGSPIGKLVGYHVRFDNCTDSETSISYMTDGILLREALNDAFLKEYSTVLVDEAHERSLHTDVLLNVLKVCQRTRASNGMTPLKIVIMSATMQADLFSNYFNDAPVYIIKGRTFPVEIFHANSLDAGSSDYLYNALVCVKDIHVQQPPTDDILVFLTGREEIEIGVKKLRELNTPYVVQHFEHKIHPVPLFAAMSNIAQMRAFQPAPAGERKVVLATNIAETSLTIPGIRVVVDSGKVKIRTFTAKDRVDVLKVQSISQAQAIQRCGRAGREAPGKCYRLYPESHFSKMTATSVPEILRSNLAAVVLEMLEMGLKKPLKLRLIESPSTDSLEAAVHELVALGAATQSGESVKMTSLGEKMAKMPLDPIHSRVLIWASELGCLEEALSVVAAMSGENVWEQEWNSKGTEEDLQRTRRRFSTTEGDHLTVLNVVQAFNQHIRKSRNTIKEFCSGNYISYKNISSIMKIRKQLREICTDQGLTVQSSGANRERVRQALACGMFLNVCEYDRQEDRYRLMVRPSTTLKIHPSSVLATSRPRHIVFSDLVRTTELYARDVSLIDAEWVSSIIDEYKKNPVKR